MCDHHHIIWLLMLGDEEGLRAQPLKEKMC